MIARAPAGEWSRSFRYDRQCALPGGRAVTPTKRGRGRGDFATTYVFAHAPQYASAEITSPPPTVPRARHV